jgi:hypothetical protein
MTDADAQQPDGQSTAEHAAISPETPAVEPAVLNGAAPGAYKVPAPSNADERPELLVGGAFAGGLVLALLLKRLAR